MELETLRIFAAVARTRSFTKGARSLYISHSTTSRAIRALEEELGVTLLKRDNRIQELTPAGELLLREAELLLLQADELKARVRAAAEETERGGSAC